MNYEKDWASELSERVAVEVLGLEWRQWKPYCAPSGWYPKNAPRCNDRDERGHSVDAEGYYSHLPIFDGDMTAAMTVVDHLLSSGPSSFRLDSRAAPRWVAIFVDENDVEFQGQDEDPAAAICLAALSWKARETQTSPVRTGLPPA